MPPRKKNILISTETLNIENIPESFEAVSKPSQPPIEVPKKRERKSKKQSVVAVVTNEGIQGNFHSDSRRPLIVHLPIHTTDIKFHDQPITYDPNPPGQPEAYDAGLIDPFSTEATYEELSVKSPLTDAVTIPTVSTVTPVTSVTSVNKKEEPVDKPVAPAAMKEYGSSTLLVQFLNSKNEQTLPEHTDAGCFWCCHSFEGRPCIIPLRIIDAVWNVYGNFCTPQCSMAYLLSENLDTHIRWERIALLNRLYGAQCNGRVYPAPSRETMDMFGGPISKEDFRRICTDQRIRVDVQIPPMVSILASMDTKPIDFYETPMRTNISPIQMKHVQQEDKTLKLKRSKPLKSKESTLDACLQIQFKTR